MDNNQFQMNLADYVLSGHALLSIDTFEKSRCVEHVSKVAKEIERKVFVWTAATGWVDEKNCKAGEAAGQLSPEETIKNTNEMPENAIYILKEFSPYLFHETYASYDLVISCIEELKELLSNCGKTIIFLDSIFKTPQSLIHDITHLDFPLPQKEDILKNIRFVGEGVQTKDGNKFQLNEELLPEVISTCSGMTSQETADRVSLAIRKTKCLEKDAIKIIAKEKVNIIKSSGLLEYREPPEGGLSIVGGYKALKRHILLDKPTFSDAAREYGIEPSKGILLGGIPGTGKTLLSLAIASEFNLPLLCLDVGSIFGSLVGESEANLRKVIKLIEGIGPCVLRVDEIEKSFGDQSDRDGGCSKRVLATLLTWLNDRNSFCYIVATANEVSQLPPELCRAGRFDAIFGLGLPQLNERKEILKIHIGKRKRNPENFNVDKLAEATKDFTGADIEESIKLGMKIAFSQKQELNDNYLLTAIEGIVPFAKIEPEKLAATMEWISKRAKLANPPEKEGIKRKVNI